MIWRAHRLWFAKNKVGLLAGELPTLLVLEPDLERDGYPTGKVDVRFGQSVIRGVEPNVLHDLVSAAKELATAKDGRSPEQHARVKAGLPADPPAPEHDSKTEELFKL